MKTLKSLKLELKKEQHKSDLLKKWVIGMFFALSTMIIGLYLNK